MSELCVSLVAVEGEQRGEASDAACVKLLEALAAASAVVLSHDILLLKKLQEEQEEEEDDEA